MLDKDIAAAITAAVDTGFEAQVRFTQEMVRCPSVRGQEHTIQDLMADAMARRGLSVDHWKVKVDDIKDLLHLDVGETESDSIGGLVYERLGEIPAVGATIQLGEATLTVEQVRRQSIQLVRITSPVPFLRERNGVLPDEDEADAG